MSALPLRPNRELGQHFLVDENILRVIERLAELSPDDRVLEIGAGTGILTRFLAARVGHVHAVEIDRSLLPGLRATLGSCENVELHAGDALRLDLAALDPPACKLVANLPYAIAAPIVVESLDRLPGLRRWCVMVQREVGERLLAEPGGRSYGAPSVLVGLTTARAGWHPVARTCFKPVPNVDSALVALARVRDWGPEYQWLKKVVQAAFAHRRKTLANSLALTGVATRAQVAQALSGLAHQATVRAESLAPAELEALAEALRPTAARGSE